MKNIFKLSAMILATAFVAGCSQNDELDVTPVENEGKLTIHATASDFVSSDADTRIINEGADTQFEAGDKIGIFAIRSTDNKLLVQNMPLEYAGADWTGNDNKVYYYKNTAYVAYSPYDEKLNITDVTGIEDLQVKIKNYFTEKLEAAGNDQSVVYPSLDLMLASAEPSDGGDANTKSLSFNFKHQFALVEIEVPVKAYLDEAKNFTYAEPFDKAFRLSDFDEALAMYPLSVKTVGEAGPEGKAYSLFRFLVKPNTNYILSGELIYTAPITLSEKNVDLEVGKYMKYKINAEGAVSSYTKRAIAVGDYYYADGSIYPGPTAQQIVNNGSKENATVTLDNYTPFKEGCIGIIFSTVTSVTDTEKGWTKGYVMALKNTKAENTVWANTKGIDETFLDNIAVDNADRFTTLIADKDGYIKTMAMINSENGYTVTSRPAFFEAVNYSVQYTTPELSSGWFLPSIGQLVDIMNNLGGVSDLITATSNFTGSAVESVFVPMLTLQVRLTAVGGELGWVNNNLRWWACNEVSSDQAWCIDIGLVANEGRAKYVLLNRDKNQSAQNYHRARPIFAF
ncbi:fimbrillin family protein [uncultured Bacteroides sp.]|uniref:fimbrillin family protein n=1 Tax=uncultured Bacteroides sp. TaxID=162156 RepID=UPI00259400A5|nr:fimbrillin family protein [uncultured Bacteroides sp.]